MSVEKAIQDKLDEIERAALELRALLDKRSTTADLEAERRALELVYGCLEEGHWDQKDIEIHQYEDPVSIILVTKGGKFRISAKKVGS